MFSFQLQGHGMSENIAAGIDLLNYHQKLIKLVDTSEAGWKAIEEYVRNLTASDSKQWEKGWQSQNTSYM